MLSTTSILTSDQHQFSVLPSLIGNPSQILAARSVAALSLMWRQFHNAGSEVKTRR